MASTTMHRAWDRRESDVTRRPPPRGQAGRQPPPNRAARRHPPRPPAPRRGSRHRHRHRRRDRRCHRRTRQQAGPAQPGSPHHAQAAQRGHGGVRQAGLPRHPGQRHRRYRQDLARHLLPVLLQQGGPAARPGGRGGQRLAVPLRHAQCAARPGHVAPVGGRLRLGPGLLGALDQLRAALPDLDRSGHGRSRAGRHGAPNLHRHVGRARASRSGRTRRATSSIPRPPAWPPWPCSTASTTCATS